MSSHWLVLDRSWNIVPRHETLETTTGGGHEMLSRIDDPLSLTGTGSVQVCGPVKWEASELTADFGFILRQEDRLLIGKSDAAVGTLMWMGKNLQRVGGAFKAGPATGTVIVVVRRSVAARPVVTATWTQDVELVPPAN
jgi:hypothetical protein